MAALIVLTSISVLSLFSLGCVAALSLNYYDKTCPNVESSISNSVKSAATKDRTVIPALLRMHFHDCFIRGCDGSILLDSEGTNKAEKDAAPNGSLHAFFVIDGAKKELEAQCPGVVSCADILAVAARDAVVLAGGPTWEVPKGRKDGRISRASETAGLPSPSFNISQLQQSFALRGLSTDDLAALLGAHTLGFAHCSSFEGRLRNFDSTHDVDPSMRPSFAARLREICPLKGRPRSAGATMDPSPMTFDNTYYRVVLQGKGLFSIDQALLTHPKTKTLVTRFAASHNAFVDAFVRSIVKLSSITGGQEVRRNCRVVN
ncbi:hypothetical protein SAY86_017715 [Trapa natans]|uniref:Peroxidase n=1 Tax=Trapa natans TaxID=22666 RepID=A0AAN7R7N7_TRANT|nr:hypothetical protein SAY86_017715 [Trapa natans]